MNNSSVIGKFLVIVIIVGILYIIGCVLDSSKPKCVESGCDNDRAPESMYCYLHKPYGSYSHKNTYGSTTSATTREEPTTRSWQGSSSNSSHSNSNPYKSYDDGYDDVYMDEDYDDDRYYSDPDYADGVDDAIEDDYEEGDGEW